MELLFLDAIPHLRIHRQKVYIPIDKKEPTKGSAVFLLNNGTDSTVDLINSQFISHNYRFHVFYMDSLYALKLFGRTIRETKLAERAAIYAKVGSKGRNITTPTSFTSVNGRNMFVDLSIYHDLFHANIYSSYTYRQKVGLYIKFIKDLLEDPRYKEYGSKILTIDIHSWTDSIKTELRGTKLYENPVFMLYYAMHKMYDDFKTLGNINIILHSNNAMMRMNPSMTDTRSFVQYRNELSKVSNKIALFKEGADLDKDIDKLDTSIQAASNIARTFNFTGSDIETEKEIADGIKSKLDTKPEDESIPVTDEKVTEVEDEALNDKEILSSIAKVTADSRVTRSTASVKRDEILREEQRKVKVGTHTLDELLQMSKINYSIEENDISEKVNTTNSNITKIRFPGFEKGYNENVMQAHTMSILTNLNNMSIPVYVRDIKIEDSSNELNYIDTYTVQLEDANRVRHTLKFDMPKFIDDKFLYLNGNRKIINKQFMAKPVVKTGPDEVQVVTNYNKVFIRRYGNKVSPKIEKFKKAMVNIPSKEGIKVIYGNNSIANNGYVTTIEYDDLSSTFTSIKIKNTEIIFNQQMINDRLTDDQRKKIPANNFCIGFIGNKEPIYFDYNATTDIIDFIMSVYEGKYIQDAFDDATTGKKFMYSRATIMSKQVPLILILGFVEGLSTVLRKAEIEHYFTDKRPRLEPGKEYIQFNNGYLVYDNSKVKTALLMNAFSDIPTKAFDYEDFDSTEVYLDIFDVMLGTRIIGNAFLNFYELMIDPITRTVLERLDYPTKFVELMLYANSLLADNSYIKENNMNLYRVRSNELVNVYLYDAISRAYSNYRATANNANPVKISVPRDAITKKILMAQTVEDYSTLNPIVELEKSRTASPKGPSGMNLDAAYTQDKRAYDRTMVGIVAMSTSPDANVGKIRQLSLEPNIIDTMGFIDVKEDDKQLDEIRDVNIFSPAELLSPLGASRDDTIRTSMATKQSKHIIPVAKTSPVLISNGAEQIIPYHLSNDFSVVAKYDGEVIEIDEKLGLIIIAYYDPKSKKIMDHHAIDINPRVVKNSSGGFYLSNKLISDLKPKQKFKKNDILASDEKFFSRSANYGVRFNIGSLQKTAIMSSYSTYEDSTFITEKLSEDMSTEMVMQKNVVLGANANVDFLVKPGDQVSVGDDLIRFESSMAESEMNKFLASIGDELHEEIIALGKQSVRAKYTGVIEDVKIYSTMDAEQLSPSLQKIVNQYYAKINRRKSLLNKYDKDGTVIKCGILINEPTGKIETKDGKIKGSEVNEGVLIEIYIKYKDNLGVGDKIAFFTALKSIVGEVIPKGYEPYTEYRTDEEISSFIAPLAVLARMTPSIILSLFGNKVLVELKRKLEEIATGKPWKNK